MAEDLLQNLGAIAKRVELALENARAVLEKLRAKRAQKRKHPRYEQRALEVEYQLFRAGTSMLMRDMLRAPVADVSAGGMRFETEAQIEVSKGQRIKFSIYKPTREIVLSGTGIIVRLVESPDGKKVLGVQFQVVKSA